MFCYGQGIIDLDAEVSDGAFDLGVSEQKLHGSQIAGAPVDQGSAWDKEKAPSLQRRADEKLATARWHTMIKDSDIEAKASELSVSPNDVEKDYVHSWVLKAISTRPNLANHTFKRIFSDSAQTQHPTRS